MIRQGGFFASIGDAGMALENAENAEPNQAAGEYA